MAKRRMFSLDIVDTDDFLDLPISAQALYFHLGMRADDDGFVAKPRRIVSAVSAKPADLKRLQDKGYVHLFDSGVCAICDWDAQNRVRRDRYTETRYQAEKRSLPVIPDVIPDVIPAVNPV